MPDFPTFADLFRVARDEILRRNPRVTRDAVEREGMDANILVAGACAAGDQIVGQLAQAMAGLYLDSAAGSALDRLVFDRYGLVRKPASAAIGTVQFSTGVASPTTFAIPVNTYLQSSSGVQYVTTESTIFNAGTTGPLTIAIRSVLAGANQNANANAVASLISTLAGAPNDLTVANVYATAGADDAETDDALRERARKFFTTARKGTLASIEAAALGVAGVRKASAFEVLDALGRPARLVELVIADAFTEQFANLTTTPALYAVQSQALASSVFTALEDARPVGTYVRVVVANVILQAFQLALTFTAGADVNEAALEARAAVVNSVNALPPGKALALADVQAALRLVPGLAYSGGEIVSPAGAIAVKPQQVLRTTLGIVAAVSAQTNQPLVTGSNPDAYALAR